MVKKTSPPPETEAVLALFRAADALRRRFVALLPPGLTFPQYNVLRILRGAGGLLPTMDIRQRMMERAPGITRIIDRLEAKGLVERQAPEHDRRQIPCRLTAAGRRVLAGLDSAMDKADRDAFAGLNRAELRRLTAQLRSVEEAARK